MMKNRLEIDDLILKIKGANSVIDVISFAALDGEAGHYEIGNALWFISKKMGETIDKLEALI